MSGGGVKNGRKVIRGPCVGVGVGGGVGGGGVGSRMAKATLTGSSAPSPVAVISEGPAALAGIVTSASNAPSVFAVAVPTACDPALIEMVSPGTKPVPLTWTTVPGGAEVGATVRVGPGLLATSRTTMMTTRAMTPMIPRIPRIRTGDMPPFVRRRRFGGLIDRRVRIGHGVASPVLSHVASTGAVGVVARVDVRPCRCYRSSSAGRFAPSPYHRVVGVAVVPSPRIAAAASTPVTYCPP